MLKQRHAVLLAIALASALAAASAPAQTIERPQDPQALEHLPDPQPIEHLPDPQAIEHVQETQPLERAPDPASEAPESLGAKIERGIASWYGPKFHGRRTSNGERFDMNELTAAHPTLPFGTKVLVHNVANGREVVVRINDRAPPLRNRIIDLSKAAAKALGFVRAGRTQVVLTQTEADAAQ